MYEPMKRICTLREFERREGLPEQAQEKIVDKAYWMIEEIDSKRPFKYSSPYVNLNDVYVTTWETEIGNLCAEISIPNRFTKKKMVFRVQKRKE